MEWKLNQNMFSKQKLSSAFFPTSEEASTMEMYLKRNLQSPLLQIPWRDQTVTPTPEPCFLHVLAV